LASLVFWTERGLFLYLLLWPMGLGFSAQPPTNNNNSEYAASDAKLAKGDPHRKWELPPRIKVVDLMTEEASAQRTLTECLRDFGYALLTLEGSNNPSEFVECVTKINHDREGYFGQPSDVKTLNKDTDGVNIGYINITGVREYIKLRASDEEKLWPKNPPTFKQNWLNLFNLLKPIAWKCFLSVAKFDAPENKLRDPEMVKAVEEFVDIKSSISLIHYYPVISEDKKCVCAAHEDTGLLTFGVVSDDPGLVIWDRVKGDWVEIEKEAKKNEIICFVGQKIPLFSGSSIWPATTHKVIVPVNVERSSLIFLLDVAK